MGMHAYWTIMCPHRGWYGNIGVLDFLAQCPIPAAPQSAKIERGQGRLPPRRSSPRDDTMSEEGSVFGEDEDFLVENWQA